MKLIKTNFADSGLEVLGEREREARQVALEYVAEAWTAAEEDGVETLALAHASLFAAVTELVDRHGEFATAALIEQLPARIRAGDYNLDRSLQ